MLDLRSSEPDVTFFVIGLGAGLAMGFVLGWVFRPVLGGTWGACSCLEARRGKGSGLRPPTRTAAIAGDAGAASGSPARPGDRSSL